MLEFAILLEALGVVVLAFCNAKSLTPCCLWGDPSNASWGDKNVLSVAASATTAWFTSFGGGGLLAVLSGTRDASNWAIVAWLGTSLFILLTLSYLMGCDAVSNHRTRFDRPTVIYSRRAFASIVFLTVFSGFLLYENNGFPGIPQRPFVASSASHYMFDSKPDGIQVLIEIPKNAFGTDTPDSTAFTLTFLNGEERHWIVSNESAGFIGRAADVIDALANEERLKQLKGRDAVAKHADQVAEASHMSRYFDPRLSTREMGYTADTAAPVFPSPKAGAKSLIVVVPKMVKSSAIVLQLRLKPIDSDVKETDLNGAIERFKAGRMVTLKATELPR